MAPEAAALRYFWGRMSRHGIILFDDYAYFGYEEQAKAIDAVAADVGAQILALPTGQRMIIR